MACIAPEDIRITYTSSDGDMDAFHELFDEALETIAAQYGDEHPLFIDGKPVTVDAPKIIDTMPADNRVVLGAFQAATPEHVDLAVAAAKRAQKAWGARPWQERVAVIHQAANVIRKRKFEIAAIMAVEVGKNRLESIGDAEESADLLDYYATQVELHHGYVQELNRLTLIETNTDKLRPYGVFACIAPFNFPAALGFGMSSGALLGGNAVVFKPASDTPWTGLMLHEVYAEAGVPDGVFNYLTGSGAVLGDKLTLHPDVNGVVFTGSKAVGMHIFHNLSKNYIKPCLVELGGKNPAIVMDSADLDMAADGVSKSAWGLQNQKCSACSRVYVHEAVAETFIEKLLERTGDIIIGEPSQRDVYFGPVINKAAIATWEGAVAQARTEGKLLCGGTRMMDDELAHGHFLAPTIAVVPLDSTLNKEEFFTPFLTVNVVDSLDTALREANATDYGLTAGFFSSKEEEVERFFNEIQSGVAYANKRSGATTGAWPGAQAFTGWKGSGGSGKGGCGPYYVAQFMREQCQTLIRES